MAPLRLLRSPPPPPDSERPLESLEARLDREQRERDGVASELLDVPAAVVCLVCGAADCTGCEEQEQSRSGIVASVAWERPGLTPWQRLWWIVLPQTLRLILAPSCNTLVSLLKQSSLAAVIALPEIMNRGWTLASENFRPIEVLTLVAVIYFVLTWPLVLLAAALERRSSLAFRSD